MAECAAWEFLTAVRNLFPELFRELESIPFEEFQEDEDNPSLGDIVFTRVDHELYLRVEEWTRAKGLSCPAVDEVAAQMRAGRTEPDSLVKVIKFRDASGKWVDGPPPIWAMPYAETLDEFLDQAREHYQKKVEFYLRHGFKVGPVKRELAHFRWLARRIVGGHSWAQIAREDNPHLVVPLSPKSVAGEARKTALLIGLPFPTKRGPRRGAKQLRRGRRPR